MSVAQLADATHGSVKAPGLLQITPRPLTGSRFAPTATTTTVGASDLPAYYGRSPVTTWMFTLADPNPVNLSGLTAVEVGVNFLAATR